MRVVSTIIAYLEKISTQINYIYALIPNISYINSFTVFYISYIFQYMFGFPHNCDRKVVKNASRKFQGSEGMVDEIWSYTSTKTLQDGAQKSGKVKDKTLLFLIIVKNIICTNLFSVMFL